MRGEVRPMSRNEWVATERKIYINKSSNKLSRNYETLTEILRITLVDNTKNIIDGNFVVILQHRWQSADATTRLCPRENPPDALLRP